MLSHSRALLCGAILVLLGAVDALRLFSRPTPKARVAVLGGGFAGLTAARTLAADKHIEVLLVDQREYFEYTPGILRAWVNPSVHSALVNPIRRLLRSKRARFERVPPGYAAEVKECDGDGDGASDGDGGGGDDSRPLRLTISREGDASPLVDYACDYAVLATGGEQAPISDDRQLPDGTVAMRRRRLDEQVAAVMENATSALVIGGGLTGVELAAELAETLGPGTVTLAVGPTLPRRGSYPGDPAAGSLPCPGHVHDPSEACPPGDPGAGLLPGFRDTCSLPLPTPGQPRPISANLGRSRLISADLGRSRLISSGLHREEAVVEQHVHPNLTTQKPTPQQGAPSSLRTPPHIPPTSSPRNIAFCSVVSARVIRPGTVRSASLCMSAISTVSPDLGGISAERENLGESRRISENLGRISGESRPIRNLGSSRVLSVIAVVVGDLK